MRILIDFKYEIFFLRWKTAFKTQENQHENTKNSNFLEIIRIFKEDYKFWSQNWFFKSKNNNCGKCNSRFLENKHQDEEICDSINDISMKESNISTFSNLVKQKRFIPVMSKKK